VNYKKRKRALFQTPCSYCTRPFGISLNTQQLATYFTFHFNVVQLVVMVDIHTYAIACLCESSPYWAITEIL